MTQMVDFRVAVYDVHMYPQQADIQVWRTREAREQWPSPCCITLPQELDFGHKNSSC